MRVKEAGENNGQGRECVLIGRNGAFSQGELQRTDASTWDGAQNTIRKKRRREQRKTAGPHTHTQIHTFTFSLTLH